MTNYFPPSMVSSNLALSLHGETKILLGNGTLKNVRDIKTGDVLAGIPEPILVVSTSISTDEKMYKVIPKFGDSFSIGENSQLLLCNNNEHIMEHVYLKDIIRKHSHFSICKTGVQFKYDASFEIEPYFFGLVLGNTDYDSLKIPITENGELMENIIHSILKLQLDFHINNEENLVIVPISEGVKKLFQEKYIPNKYKFNDQSVRLKLLAGIIDSNSVVHPSNNFIQILNLSKQFADDIYFLCFSIGHCATKHHRNNSFSIHIHG